MGHVGLARVEVVEEGALFWGLDWHLHRIQELARGSLVHGRWNGVLLRQVHHHLGLFTLRQRWRFNVVDLDLLSLRADHLLQLVPCADIVELSLLFEGLLADLERNAVHMKPDNFEDDRNDEGDQDASVRHSMRDCFKNGHEEDQGGADDHEEEHAGHALLPVLVVLMSRFA